MDGSLQAMTMCFRIAGADYAVVSEHPRENGATCPSARRC